MSERTKSPVNRRTALRFLGAGVVVSGAAALGGCQIRPLHGDRTLANGTSRAASELASIQIDPPSNRTTQLVRNELVFRFGGDGGLSTYRLALGASRVITTLGVDGTGATFARTLRVAATYQLFRLGEDEPLTENTVIANAGFDEVEQEFANERAAIDAEQRAAREVAAVINAQLAAFFAT
ncbi:MAG: LPS assembly lipoprotein LptE [Pseudomonadota bacterium]